MDWEIKRRSVVTTKKEDTWSFSIDPDNEDSQVSITKFNRIRTDILDNPYYLYEVSADGESYCVGCGQSLGTGRTPKEAIFNAIQEAVEKIEQLGCPNDVLKTLIALAYVYEDQRIVL